MNLQELPLLELQEKPVRSGASGLPLTADPADQSFGSEFHPNEISRRSGVLYWWK